MTIDALGIENTRLRSLIRRDHTKMMPQLSGSSIDQMHTNHFTALSAVSNDRP